MSSTDPGGQDGVKRRDFLYISTTAFGGVGVAVAAWPFVHQMNPSADVLALSSIEIDISGIADRPTPKGVKSHLVRRTDFFGVGRERFPLRLAWLRAPKSYKANVHDDPPFLIDPSPHKPPWLQQQETVHPCWYRRPVDYSGCFLFA